jgi:hypothetical protein
MNVNVQAFWGFLGPVILTHCLINVIHEYLLLRASFVPEKVSVNQNAVNQVDSPIRNKETGGG